MNDLLRYSQRFLKRNASTILTCVGSAGVVATAVMAAKATPKALELIEEAKNQKGEELTTAEVVKTAAPAYLPTVVVGVSTIACIFGANVLNKHKQAALASAYALLDNSYKEYKKKVIDLYGEEVDTHIKKEITKDKYQSREVSNGKELFFDFHSMRYFESTMEDVLKAEMELNKELAEEYYVSVNRFYELLGLPTLPFEDECGWSIGAGGSWYGYTWIEFQHEKTIMDDGLECRVITMKHEPTVDYQYY